MKHQKHYITISTKSEKIKPEAQHGDVFLSSMVSKWHPVSDIQRPNPSQTTSVWLSYLLIRKQRHTNSNASIPLAAEKKYITPKSFELSCMWSSQCHDIAHAERNYSLSSHPRPVMSARASDQHCWINYEAISKQSEAAKVWVSLHVGNVKAIAISTPQKKRCPGLIIRSLKTGKINNQGYEEIEAITFKSRSNWTTSSVLYSSKNLATVYYVKKLKRYAL